MAVRIIEGFDWSRNMVALARYLDYTNFLQVGDTAPAPPVIGGGRSFSLMNTAFGVAQYTRVVGTIPLWSIGFHIRFTDPFGGGPANNVVFFRLESLPSYAVFPSVDSRNDGVELALRTRTDGRIEVMRGGKGTNAEPGSVIASPAFTFTQGSWYHVEFLVHFAPSGFLKMFVDDVEVYSATSLNLGSTPPDRYSLRWESFGTRQVAWDDLYVDDATRHGPAKVTTSVPDGPGHAAEWSLTGAPTHWEAVDDYFNPGAPSADFPDMTTYIDSTSALAQLDSFKMGAMPCYGRILAVATNASGWNPSGVNAPGIRFSVRARPSVATDTDLGLQLWPAPSTWSPLVAVQAISPTDPATGTYWVDRHVSQAFWGYRAAGAGPSRVTQVFLEKLVSLRDDPFNCGRSPYAFGRG